VSRPSAFPGAVSTIKSFNPVLGFLSVSTQLLYDVDLHELQGFNPVLGFLSVSTAVGSEVFGEVDVSIPCWVF